MQRGIPSDQADDLAEDVVQTASLFFVGRSWNEGLFVGKVRYVAMRAGEVSQHVFLVRNTCEERVGKRGYSTRAHRARVTNCFPVQIFGTMLA